MSGELARDDAPAAAATRERLLGAASTAGRGVIAPALFERFGEDLVELVRAVALEVVREELAAQQAQTPQREWVTAEEAATALDISRDAVRMRVKRRRLEGRLDGRRLLVTIESVRRAGGDV